MTPEEYKEFLLVYQGKRFSPEFRRLLVLRSRHALMNNAEHVFINPDDGWEVFPESGRDLLRHNILFHNFYKKYL